MPDVRVWVEVKPSGPDAAAIEKASRLVQSTGFPLFMTHGMPTVAVRFLSVVPDTGRTRVAPAMLRDRAG